MVVYLNVWTKLIIAPLQIDSVFLFYHFSI